MPAPALTKLYEEIETLIGEVGAIDNEMGNDLGLLVTYIKSMPQETAEKEIEIRGLLEAFVVAATTVKNKAKET